jgi:hypothetical protein
MLGVVAVLLVAAVVLELYHRERARKPSAPPEPPPQVKRDDAGWQRWDHERGCAVPAGPRRVPWIKRRGRPGVRPYAGLR